MFPTRDPFPISSGIEQLTCPITEPTERMQTSCSTCLFIVQIRLISIRFRVFGFLIPCNAPSLIIKKRKYNPDKVRKLQKPTSYCSKIHPTRLSVRSRRVLSLLCQRFMGSTAAIYSYPVTIWSTASLRVHCEQLHKSKIIGF